MGLLRWLFRHLDLSWKCNRFFFRGGQIFFVKFVTSIEASSTALIHAILAACQDDCLDTLISTKSVIVVFLGMGAKYLLYNFLPPGGLVAPL